MHKKQARTKGLRPLGNGFLDPILGAGGFAPRATYFLCEQKVGKSQRAAPFGERFFSTPFLLFAYKRNGVEPPKKIRQRGASVTFGLLPLTIGNSFVKTLPFSFRCRCAGASLQEMRSLAPMQQQVNLQCRRHSMARQAITSSIGAAAINSGFACRFTTRRSVERCTCSLRPRNLGVLRGETL